MPRWIRLVAFSVLAFVLLDVCTPEPCDAEVAMPSSSSSQLAAIQGATTGNDCCPFEEDCFNCAHYAPPASVRFEPVAMIGLAEPTLNTAVLSGAPPVPYHPPRG